MCVIIDRTICVVLEKLEKTGCDLKNFLLSFFECSWLEMLLHRSVSVGMRVRGWPVRDVR